MSTPLIPSTSSHAPAVRITPQTIIAILAGSLGCGSIAAVLAAADLKAQLVALGVIVAAFGLLLVRDRPRFVLFVLVLNLQLLFSKALGPLSPEVHPGAPGLYVNTVEMLVLVLYAMWIAEGTILDDIQRVMADRAFGIPLLAALAVIPSFLVAENPGISFAEFFQMGWSLALYVYIAARVRTRPELWTVLVGLFAVVFMQSALVIFQWKSGSTSGFTLISQGEFITRTANDEDLLRPQGTLFHPEVLGLVMGMISLIGFCGAIHLRKNAPRVLCALVFVSAVIPIFIAQARAALLALALVGGAIVAIELYRGNIPWRVIGAAAAALLIAVAAMWDPISHAVENNVGTEHFWAEVTARNQLNDVAFAIIQDAPLVGVGLNNYAGIMDRYEPYGVDYPGFPVHNLFLLVWAETGIFGLVGLLVTFAVLIRSAWRLNAASDPLFRALGIALAADCVFVCVEQMMSFGLKIANSNLVFWLIAGLIMATRQMALGPEKHRVRAPDRAGTPSWPLIETSNPASPTSR